MEKIVNSLLKGFTENYAESDFFKWLKDYRDRNNFEIKIISLENLDNWFIEPSTNNIKHSTGKFYTIEGINIETNFGKVAAWDQPIINQPEIGILGIITKIKDNVRYFLMQAKMEPGNIDELQISPTLQATKSNFTQQHKGKPPLYLEYFINKNLSKVLIDQHQTEQAGRFYRKRNRNIIIEITDNIEIYDGFVWLTLGQINTLLNYDNLINMDSRSVLSCISYNTDNDFIKYLSNIDINSNSFYLINSLFQDNSDINSIDSIISWVNDQKNEYFPKVQFKGISSLNKWNILNGVLQDINKKYFEVIGVKVKASNREVSNWTQPMIADCKIGLSGFILTKINNKFYFLVQAKSEPGSIDSVDLAPTVSCSDYNNANNEFLENFLKCKKENILYDKNLSEEGGRFFKLQNRYMIIIDNTIETNDIPKNYKFLNLHDILFFAKFSYFNIEARTLLSCINYFTSI